MLAPEEVDGMGYRRPPAASMSPPSRRRERRGQREEPLQGGGEVRGDMVRGVHPQMGEHWERRTAKADATAPHPADDVPGRPALK